MNVIITGTNGMIGNLVLKNCLNRSYINKITSVTRKRTGIVHPKLSEVILDDFSDYSSIKESLKDQQICFYCLGVYTGAVSKKDFYKITVEFTRSFAEALSSSNKETTFCFLSGQGADSKEKSPIMFAREKGIAENLLLKFKFNRTHIFRPGYIYPVTPRTEPNTIYKVMRILYKTFSGIFPDMGITSEKLAETMVDVAFADGTKIYYENKEIRCYKNKGK